MKIRPSLARNTMPTCVQGSDVQRALSAASDITVCNRKNNSQTHTPLTALNFLGESANLSRVGNGISLGDLGPLR